MFQILIVDDNPNDIKGIVGLVKWSDLDISVAGTAKNGLEGYKKALELKPDFILTDVSMPGMNGIEMTDSIKSELPDTKFVFMSCYDDVAYLQSAINLDVSAYVLKPVDLKELQDAIIKVRELKKNEINRRNNEAELKKIISESLPLIQEQFLREIFYGKITDNCKLKERLDYLGMDFSHRYYSVLFIKIDNYELLYEDLPVEEKHFLIYGLQKYVEEALTANNSGYITSQQYQSLAVIIFFNSDSREQALEQLINNSNSLIDIVNLKLNIKITIGMSTLSEDLSEIPAMFQNAESASKSKFHSKGNQIIQYSEIWEPEAILHYNLQDIMHEITSLVEGNNEEEISLFIEKYYKTGVKYSERYVKEFLYSAVNIVQTILINNNLSFSSIFEDELVVWRKLSMFETIVDIRQFLSNILIAVRQLFDRNDGNAHLRIVDDIKDIIDMKYSELENVNQIVENLYISASHANHLFKQSTGQTIFDYLVFRRVEAAKKMLQDPYIKINEIPEKIGYKTSAHFRAVFKELTGQTPRQYQDRYSI